MNATAPQSAPRSFWRRTLYPLKLIAGVIVIIIGIIDIPLPGPGWAIVIAGIFLIAPESRLAHWLRRKFHQVKDQALRMAGRSKPPDSPPGASQDGQPDARNRPPDPPPTP
jgi:uncharacterized protein (TIGR02611 family)